MSASRFYVENLDRWLSDLGVTPGRLKAAEKTMLQTAGLAVQVGAKEQARSLGSVYAKSAVDVRAAGPGVVRYGGKPYNMGAEYGSYRYKQFNKWRGNGEDAGYFFWPAIRRFRDTEMLDLWMRETWGAIQPAFTG